MKRGFLKQPSSVGSWNYCDKSPHDIEHIFECFSILTITYCIYIAEVKIDINVISLKTSDVSCKISAF